MCLQPLHAICGHEGKEEGYGKNNICTKCLMIKSKSSSNTRTSTTNNLEQKKTSTTIAEITSSSKSATSKSTTSAFAVTTSSSYSNTTTAFSTPVMTQEELALELEENSKKIHFNALNLVAIFFIFFCCSVRNQKQRS
jgi:hypothetical protein